MDDSLRIERMHEGTYSHPCSGIAEELALGMRRIEVDPVRSERKRIADAVGEQITFHIADDRFTSLFGQRGALESRTQFPKAQQC